MNRALSPVGSVPSPSHLDHLRGAVDRRDPPAIEPLTDKGHGYAMAAPDLEDRIAEGDVENLNRPTEPVRCRAG
jgi:hypothetical protein